MPITVFPRIPAPHLMGALRDKLLARLARLVPYLTAVGAVRVKKKSSLLPILPATRLFLGQVFLPAVSLLLQLARISN